MAVKKARLAERLTELGFAVDPKETVEDLRARLSPEELAALEEETEPTKTVGCVVLRDYWPTEDTRVRAGAVVQLSVEDAMDGVESGALSRVKDDKK